MQAHAFEAILADATSLMGLALGLLDHDKGSLFATSVLPAMAMFVVDSRKALRVLDPELARTLEDEFLSQLAHSRKRAKLLDDRRVTIEDAARELTDIASNQTRFFLGLHTGSLGALKRVMQPDIGLTIYEDHLVSTTHFTAAIVGWDSGEDPSVLGRRIAVASSEFASYTLNLLLSLGLAVPEPLSVTALDGTVVMRDAHSPALYKRGAFERLPHELSVGAVGVLATINHLRRIVMPVLPSASLTAFRLKTITAFHADSYLVYLQGRLYRDFPDNQLKAPLAATLGQPGGRWLRRRKLLRNTLVHYLATPIGSSIGSGSRKEVLSRLGGKSIKDMDTLIDSHLLQMAILLEQALELSEGVSIGGLVQ